MKQQSLVMQKDFTHKKKGEAMRCSTDTSRWSGPSSCGSDTPQYMFECEDKVDATPSVKWQGSEQSGRKLGILFGKKAQGGHMQKKNSTTNCRMVNLPPVRSLETSKPRIQSASLNCIRELKSKVWRLQQQLCESRTENKLLKKEQHRHMVALQHFQNSEDSVSQIVTKHRNEARVLQGLLRETRTCRDNLARQLHATEDKLLYTKETLQHLELLIQDHSLLEREELSLRLAKASAELEEKDKKILAMEKNLELCQASFKRQIVTEQRKIKEAKKISTHLQEQIYQLTKALASREREMQKHNLYSHRFLKGSSNRGRENKMVQTDGLVLLPTDAASLLENEYSEPIQRLEQQESSVNWCGYGPVQESLVIKNLEREGPANLSLDQEDAQISANTSEKNSSSDKSPELLYEEDCVKEKEASESTRAFDATEPEVKYLFSDTCSDESPENENNGDRVKEKRTSEVLQVSEEKRETEHESTMAFVLETSQNPAAPKRKELRLPRFRHIYTFIQTTENLHNGRPAYRSVDLDPQESSKVEILSRGISDLHLPEGKTKEGGAHSSQSE